MLRTAIIRGSYHDSVVLMLLTNELSTINGVKKVSVMMATPANKDLFRQNGLSTKEVLEANASDMVIAADVDQEALMDKLLEVANDFFIRQSKGSEIYQEQQFVTSWEEAKKTNPGMNLAIISIPGAYAALEAERALDEGMNVFLFSDNVCLNDEKALKEKAHEKGLCVMGPDCGTGIIQGIPLAFTNSIKPGPIGIIGASGTGIQELTTIIDRLGEGVTNAIGIGGRDLTADIGGITMLDMIDVMEEDDSIKVLIILSKPPAKEVRDKIYNRLSNFEKPVITLFMGEKPEYHEENLYHAYTLDEAARLAVQLVRGGNPLETKSPENPFVCFPPEQNKTIKAYYSGGTLANEAAMLIKDALNDPTPPEDLDGYMLHSNGNIVIDLGDDVFTRGKPHPMIDPGTRIQCMERAVDDPSTGVILFDIILGYGSHPDMAGALLPTIQRLQKKAAQDHRNVSFVATVCGSSRDIQGYDATVEKLTQAGVMICESNKCACRTALRIIGKDFQEPVKKIYPRKSEPMSKSTPSPQLKQLLSDKPRILNIGLSSFSEVCRQFGCETVQYNWKPPAGGNIELIRAISFLRKHQAVDMANQAVMARIVAGRPVLKDVVPAKEVIPELAEGKVLLHAGPPIEYQNMPDPMKGSCIGAILFQQWASDAESAKLLLEQGHIEFIPCHHVNAVGPMGGITSPDMPVFVVKNETDGNSAYCSLNEGIGKVLRFGAYSSEVIARLSWMKQVLAPTLQRALREMTGGLPLNPLIAKAIAMGDEFHQRNIAASLCLFKELVPTIVRMNIAEKDRFDVIKFLADTDQFFLNIMMAAGKAIMDSARKLQEGTIVTAMCRNGMEFGIRISGMGDQWFTGPVNTPQGLYFTGYGPEDACPDMGDSAITETLGVGGMAMVAAPAVTRFVGSGKYGNATQTSNTMSEISLGNNPNYIIPNWNFRGACLGIDARLVVEKEITPVINTGIAHKEAGYGQIGAGTVHPPIQCFEKAVLAYAKKLGFST